jgi:hypothetical protein
MAVKLVRRAVDTADVVIGRGTLPQEPPTPRDLARDCHVVVGRVSELLQA